MRVAEDGHNHPFADRWSVDSAAGRQGDLAGGVDGVVDQMIAAG